MDAAVLFGFPSQVCTKAYVSHSAYISLTDRCAVQFSLGCHFSPLIDGVFYRQWPELWLNVWIAWKLIEKVGFTSFSSQLSNGENWGGTGVCTCKRVVRDCSQFYSVQVVKM